MQQQEPLDIELVPLCLHLVQRRKTPEAELKTLSKCIQRLEEANEYYDVDTLWWIKPNKVWAVLAYKEDPEEDEEEETDSDLDSEEEEDHVEMKHVDLSSSSTTSKLLSSSSKSLYSTKDEVRIAMPKDMDTDLYQYEPETKPIKILGRLSLGELHFNMGKATYAVRIEEAMILILLLAMVMVTMIMTSGSSGKGGVNPVYRVVEAMWADVTRNKALSR